MKGSGKIQKSLRDAVVTEVQRPAIEFELRVELALGILKGDRRRKRRKNDNARVCRVTQGDLVVDWAQAGMPVLLERQGRRPEASGT